MNSILFLPSLDSLLEEKYINSSKTLSGLEGKIKATKDQADMFYYGIKPLPEGKRRKAGSLELEDIPQPPTDELFAEEMETLNAEYDKNMAILANKYNIAVARDGSQETAKVESARAEISTLDAQYESDKLAIINKYYGA